MSDLNITFKDGTVCPLRLTYRDLYELERAGKWEENLDEFFRIRQKGLNPKRQEFDVLKVLHIAYLCAEKDEEKQMDFGDFLDNMDIYSSRDTIAAFSELWSKKK